MARKSVTIDDIDTTLRRAHSLTLALANQDDGAALSADALADCTMTIANLIHDARGKLEEYLRQRRAV